MSRRAVVLAATAVVVVAVIAVVAASGAREAAPAAPDAAVATATVRRGPLAATVSQNGTLTYRARSDGSPYAVVNRAAGVYTALPDDGEKAACGDTLYRVDDAPVLLLCGAIPAYRDLRGGDSGRDVRQLNRNLHALGYDARAGVDVDPHDDHFTGATERALEALQDARGLVADGELALGDAVFLPEAVRIGRVAARLGASARPGAQVAQATSDTLEVRVDLDASQQGVVEQGDHALVTLPGNRSARGTVARIGAVAQAPGGQDQDPAAATLPAHIALDDRRAALGLDSAPVRVDIRTEGVDDALSVPVTALVGKAGGGFAVEVVRDGGRRELVAVRLGLFDSGGGRVEVTGDLRAGDRVVVPSL